MKAEKSFLEMPDKRAPFAREDARIVSHEPGGGQGKRGSEERRGATGRDLREDVSGA